MIASPLYSLDQREQDPDCCNVGNIVYRIASLCLQTDYRTLAIGDHLWLLRKKIGLNEDNHHLDSYYIKHMRTLIVPESREITITTYETPLHAAVYSGNLKCAQLLCASGADRHKPIKDATTIRSEEIAAFPEMIFHIESYVKEEEFESKIQQVKEKDMIGMTAIELARKMIKRTDDYILNKKRRAILAFLEKEE